MRFSVLLLMACIASNLQIAFAGELPGDSKTVYLSCSPERCENKHYDIGTKISTTTDCLSITVGSAELSFPASNGSYTSQAKEYNAQRIKDVTDSTFKQTLKYELGGIKNVSTVIVNRITGKYSEYKEQYSNYGTDKESISGVCLPISNISNRKF